MTNNTVKDSILTLFPDNNTNEISAADMRTYVEGVFADKEVKVSKINTLSNLAANNANIYEGTLVVVYRDNIVGNIGLYISTVNQPTSSSELIQITSFTAASDISFLERGARAYNELVDYFPGDIVTMNNRTYICIIATPDPAGVFNETYWDVLLYGPARVVSTVTASSTVSDGDHTTIVDATAGDITVTMPSAVGRSYLEFRIKRSDSSNNSVFLVPDGVETIDTETLISMQLFESLTLVSDNANWFIV